MVSPASTFPSTTVGRSHTFPNEKVIGQGQAHMTRSAPWRAGEFTHAAQPRYLIQAFGNQSGWERIQLLSGRGIQRSRRMY